MYSLVSEITFHCFSSANTCILQTRKKIFNNFLDLCFRIQVCERGSWLYSKSCVKQKEGIIPPLSPHARICRCGCSRHLACVSDGTVPWYKVTCAWVLSGWGLSSVSQTLIPQTSNTSFKYLLKKTACLNQGSRFSVLTWGIPSLISLCSQKPDEIMGKKFAVSIVAWFDVWMIHWLLPKDQSNLKNTILGYLSCFYRSFQLLVS